MQSKDIIMQVSEETAEIMEEISEQLFQESENRFDEIVAAIEESIKRVETLYSEFTGFAGNSNEQTTSNQIDLMDKFATVLDSIVAFRKDVGEQTVQSNEKIDRLIVLVSDIPQLIQAVSNSISEYSVTRNKFESTLLQTVDDIIQSLAELQKIQSNVMEKLNSDDSHKKMIFMSNKISSIEEIILQIKDSIGSISGTLFNCAELIEQILSSVKGLQENGEKILYMGEENSKNVGELGKQTSENSKLLLEKLDYMLTYLDTLSHSVQAISETQSVLCEKQAELEKDVQYLKIPFFKRGFTKGEE